MMAKRIFYFTLPVAVLIIFNGRQLSCAGGNGLSKHGMNVVGRKRDGYCSSPDFIGAKIFAAFFVQAKHGAIYRKCGYMHRAVRIVKTPKLNCPKRLFIKFNVGYTAAYR